jgi:hypothetical protein
VIIARVGKLKFIGGDAIQAAFPNLGQQILGGKIAISLPLQRGQICLRFAQCCLVGRPCCNDQLFPPQVSQFSYAWHAAVAYQQFAHTLVAGPKLNRGGIILDTQGNRGKVGLVLAQRGKDLVLRKRDQFNREMQLPGEQSNQFPLEFGLRCLCGFRHDHNQFACVPWWNLLITGSQEQV